MITVTKVLALAKVSILTLAILRMLFEAHQFGDLQGN
jgi:hypothetical protein